MALGTNYKKNATAFEDWVTLYKMDCVGNETSKAHAQVYLDKIANCKYSDAYKARALKSLKQWKEHYDATGKINRSMTIALTVSE